LERRVRDEEGDGRQGGEFRRWRIDGALLTSTMVEE